MTIRPGWAAWRQRGLAASLVVALGGWQPFRTPDRDVEAGNLAYAEGRYDDALAAYDRAARRGGVDPDGLAFDRGTAELKKAEATKDPAEQRRLIERGIDDLKQAGRSKDPHIRGAASYNRGNALMTQDKLEDAIEAYKQALRDDPELDDARLNLELALRRRQAPPKPPQPGGQGQGQQGQGQGQQGQQGQGQQQGQGGGSNPQDGSNGQGSNAQPPPGANGQGAGSSSRGASGQGSNDPGSNDPGSNDRGSDDQGSNAQGAGAQGSNAPDAQRPQNGAPPPRNRAPGNARPPRTPGENRLDDLDEQSRRLQKARARRSATGRANDPQRDW